MKRGGFGSPYRPPADGWPRKIYSTGLYSNIVDDLNGLARYSNNTNITLQPGQVGRPMTKPLQVTTNGCEAQLNNGLPYGYWIGLYGDGNYLPPALGGRLRNTFAQNGTTDRGANCRQRGFKNVQAGRSWHGSFGWNSYDSVACTDTICQTEVNDASGNAPGSPNYTPTYTYTSFLSPQLSAQQTQYLTVTVSATQHSEGGWFDGYYGTQDRTAGGGVSVDALSGKITNSLSTTEVEKVNSEVFYAGSEVQSGNIITRNISNGAGDTYNSVRTDGGVGPPTWTQVHVAHFNSGATTSIDGICAVDVHCSHVDCVGISDVGFEDTTIDGLQAAWNAQVRFNLANPDLFPGYSTSDLLPEITNQNSYSGSVTHTYASGDVEAISIAWSRAATVYSWDVTYTFTPADTDDLTKKYSFSGSLTLSNANPASSVYTDAQNLLGYWNLADDAKYPFRTDGIWQIAPLVTRDESGDRSPLTGFLAATLDDRRSPAVDANGNSPFTDAPGVSPTPPGWQPQPGWTDGSTTNNDSQGNPPGSPSYLGAYAWVPTYNQMTWYDTAAYGFVYGTDPVANKNGALALSWKQYALTGKILGMPMPAAFSDPNSYWYDPGVSVGGTVCFEDFFDYHAALWKCCDNGVGGDWYQQGWGEWLSDAIARTGAQLPFCATQWANNQQAKTIPPYASIINYDKWQYASSEGGEVLSSLPSVFVQKCCEIVELWPSQNFFRPAGADKFLIDETTVYCTDGVKLYQPDGVTPATGLNLTGYWGGAFGFYNGATTDSSGNLTLGSKVYNPPSNWATNSGDTASAFGKLRFSTAPSILGRAAVTSVGTAFTFAMAQTAFGMAVAGTETVDVYDASMTSLASGISATRVDDTHFTLPSAYATAAYVMIHGAPGYGWDDNMRKGDFVMYQWLFDFRTSGEYSRLQSVTDCSGNTPPSGSPSNPVSIYQNPNALSGYNDGHGNTLVWDGANFQGQGTIKYVPCSPCVICCSPNGETFHNGVVIGFPGTFNFDARYGARWQLEFEQAMIDLLYQGPHAPCGVVSPSTWREDGLTGFCQADAANGNGGTDHYFIGRPYVEARSVLPAGAPALPGGITIGALNPVTNAGGLGAPGTPPPNYLGFNIGSGNPNGAWTWWGYRYSLESSACPPASCRFDYVDQENLACVTSASSTPSMVQNQPLSGLGGLT